MKHVFVTATAFALVASLGACKKDAAADTAATTEATKGTGIDGTWVVDINSVKITGKPVDVMLKDGTYSCTSCVPAVKVAADGAFHAVTGLDYADINRDEVWLLGADIPEYLQANQMNHKPKRPRKLLLHRAEIAKLTSRASEKGLTIVPLSVYFKKGIAKVEICIARGRKSYDKREAIKQNDAKRDIERALRRR